MPAELARRRVLALLAASAATPVRGQGFAGLGQEAGGFAMPRPDPAFRFPRDHGPHPQFRIEWWYVTANLKTAAGADRGIQWTLFRSALAPQERPGWASPQIWFAHAAMTGPEAHLVAERRARGGIGQAGVTPAPFAAWIDDWQMTGHPGADALDRLSLRAAGRDWSYELSLAAAGPLVLHGQGGYSLKHPRGQASYYYSQPGYRVTGRLGWPGGAEEVTGLAWLDREWSSQPLDADQTGWDWFSLHLDGGDRLMVYRLRDGGAGHVPGTWISPDGRAEAIADGAIELAPLDWTRIGERRLPTSWRIRIPSRGLQIETRPVNAHAWMGTGIPYWEGPVRVTGSRSGIGYLEMTGHD
ncbi:lipocalin-like domain-containing protein [Mangrovicoccus algicola]|uniref:Iron ABC transporter permease n=1 Tax=Mangrovicoccus algicola TaxID=2771008 RepID=A0A8J6Z9G6_9RHOB|nr:lipocalin-like domain-containing protein [Mangrovicoccus algicola]MBE3638456.1 iron ABC transporter permease [Mangrovicoccus algicola]